MERILCVSDINHYIKELFTYDEILSNIWIKGEISNFKDHSSGHMYFTLKDSKASIKCVMFKTYNQHLKFKPQDGMGVLIRGNISVFERDGQYQLYAEEIVSDGAGSLHMAFEQLKKKLSKEGLFDEIHKKKIPYLPNCIGVVTSPTGAVIKDILNVLSRRFYNIELKIFPVAVQGENAPGEIHRAIQKLNELKCVDVIIVARGGGSIEELWAFNEEVVARSIFESEIPVISAVGHETDYTIADFVADLRAPTPSAAAELVVPLKETLEYEIVTYRNRLKNSLSASLSLKKSHFDSIKKRSVLRQPLDRIFQERIRLDIIFKNLCREIKMSQMNMGSKFAYINAKLDALSPLSILSRGYSIIKNAEKDILIKSVNDVKKNDILDLTVKDGKISCVVNSVKGEV